MTTNSATSVSFGKRDLVAGEVDRAERDAQRLGEADEQRRDERARDRAQAADDGDDERFRDDRQVHAEVGGLAGQLQRAGESGEEGAEGEHEREERALVDAERARERAVLGRGARQRPETRSLEQPPKREQHQRPDAEQEEIVGGNQPAEDGHCAAQSRRARTEQVLRAPDEQARRRGRSARCRMSRRAEGAQAPRRCA